MSHKALIGGTAREITGGKVLVGGTGYDIASGRTLIGGTGYEIDFSGETVIFEAGDTTIRGGTVTKQSYYWINPSGGSGTKTDIYADYDKEYTVEFTASGLYLRLGREFYAGQYSEFSAGEVLYTSPELTDYKQMVVYFKEGRSGDFCAKVRNDTIGVGPSFSSSPARIDIQCNTATLSVAPIAFAEYALITKIVLVR